MQYKVGLEAREIKGAHLNPANHLVGPANTGWTGLAANRQPRGSS